MAIRSIRRLREAVAKVFRGSSIVSGTTSMLWKPLEEPTIRREDYVKLYEENPLAREAIDMTVADAIGGGYFTDVKEDKYAKKLVDDFAEKVDLDSILFLSTRDMLVTGDGINEKIFDKEVVVERVVEYNGRTYRQQVIAPAPGAKLVNLKWVPSFTFKVARTPVGEVLWWQQQVGSKSIYFHPDKIMDYKWNPTGLNAYGTSELKCVYGLLKDLDEIRKNFVAITKRYASPPIIWKAKGLSRAQIEELKRTVENKKPDEDVYLNTDLIEAEVLEVDPRGRFENYYQQLMNAASIGLMTPTLVSLEQATLASSKAMLEFYEKKIARIRRIIKRNVEKGIFRVLVEQDSRAREVPRLRWETLSKRVERTGAELALELFDRNIYSPWQLQQVLKKSGVPFPPEPEEAKAFNERVYELRRKVRGEA